MSWAAVNGLEYFKFDIFASCCLDQGIFTRKGGISPSPWTSLNLGGTVGDDRVNVIENRERIFAAVNRKVSTIFDVWQVHSADVIVTNGPRGLDDPHVKGDAILTNNPDVTLVMRFADCVPIFLHDPAHQAIGIVHAGWQGTVKKVVQHTVEKMGTEYGSRPEEILAGIGPSIGPDHYQVGRDVIEQVKAAFIDQAGEVLVASERGINFDLWRANEVLLQEAGVRNIETAGICTACDLSRWYSHRAENGKTGRFGAVLGLSGG